jgi:hypothetical protein
VGGSSDGGPLRVAALVPDLMDRSRIEPIAASAGVSLTFVADVGGLRAPDGHPWDLVILDLGAPNALTAVPEPSSARTVGFGSHVDREQLAAARRAGCSEVVSRSVFFRRLKALLKDGRA